MSVQAGIWNFDGRPVDRKVLIDFSRTLQMHGPDGEFSHTDGSIAMLYRPFHTTPESRREKQPYFSPRNFVLTWDGRVDNRNELIGSLDADVKADTTDVALVAAAFDRWETDCFRRIIGDWAAVVWTPERRTLLLACDYMSIRHIFYSLKSNCIWWSTELSPLVVLSDNKLEIDEEYIAGYLANYPDAHVTPYRGIRQVSPGHVVSIFDRRASMRRYWRFRPQCRLRYKTDGEYEEHFRYVFRQSMWRRLHSDSPILAELSGGLDSSSIVCMADHIIEKETHFQGLTPRLDTLSYCDTSEPGADDCTYLQRIEEKRGRVGAHIDSSKIGLSVAPFAYFQFTPLPGYFGARRGIEAERARIVHCGQYRVTLSGIGGDEFLGGIPNPSTQLADLILQLKLVPLWTQLIAWSLVKKKPWPHLLWQASLHLLPLCIGKYLINQANVEPWIQREFAQRCKLAIRQLDVDEHFGLWLPSRRSYIGGVLMMANKLAKQMSSATMLEETRYPFLDQDFIEFILAIPATQLLRPGERRSLMRRALVGVVPQEILSRRTKQFGARAPIVVLENNWEELQLALQMPIMSQLGYIDRKRFVEALYAAKSGKSAPIVQLLKSISLEFWLRDLGARGFINVPMISTASRPLPRDMSALRQIQQSSNITC